MGRSLISCSREKDLIVERHSNTTESTEEELRDRVGQWANTLNTLTPCGFRKDDFLLWLQNGHVRLLTVNYS